MLDPGDGPLAEVVVLLCLEEGPTTLVRPTAGTRAEEGATVVTAGTDAIPDTVMPLFVSTEAFWPGPTLLRWPVWNDVT